MKRMKPWGLVFTAGIGVLMACAIKPALDTRVALDKAKAQLETSLTAYTDLTQFPRGAKADGSYRGTKSSEWTSGFYPATLWYMYEYTHDQKWADAAKRWTAGMEKEQFNTHTHDLGFMLYCPFGNGYRLTNDPVYKDVMLQGARSLSTRFNEKTGCIKSWDHGKWQFPVIIDNMMNLELLFWATRVSGDSSFYKVAVTHANTTLKNHFRADNSSYHVVDYDTLTGKVIQRVTHQGYADESAWARGQAWGLYGYTVAYRETKDKRYLDQAVKIAGFYLKHPNLPADKVPYWDFNAPGIPKEERDASAAAITASGLLELSTYVKDGKPYVAAAEQMLTSLGSPAYLAKPGENNHFVLLHSVGHKPAKSEIDVPLVYADYYYIEGLLRYQRLKDKPRK
jgi:unsaturated chondroitin disaccharide hydrolase